MMSRRDMIAAAAASAALGVPARAAAAPIGPMLPGVRIKPDREAMVPVPGGRVYVRVNGNLNGPRPPLVMMHGGPGSSHWYFLNATAMAGNRAIILYDQLDSGRSAAPGDAANWVLPRFVDELAAIKAYLGVNRWHVLGASWGGTIGLEYGATRPEGLASLILQSPLVSTADWLRDANALRAAMPPAVRDALDACDLPGGDDTPECVAATDAFYRAHVHLSDPPPAIAAYKAALPRSFSNDIYNHMWGRAEFVSTGTLRHYDGRPLLQKLDGQRTLFLAGAADEAIPATVAGYAHAANGARFAEIPDAAHTALGDNPAAYLAVLAPWLVAHDAG
jgi:L-proline amide hydrolase